MRYQIAFLVVAGALALAGCGGGKSSSATTASGPVTITVQVKGGKPVGGIQRATANKGEQVAIVVHSDVADEVHVHGYDLHKDVKAG
jgi:ABC-type glycerol-3-phosphate transport system substrate-binding protein